MSEKFKKGDLVYCIDSSRIKKQVHNNIIEDLGNEFLQLNKIYRVNSFQETDRVGNKLYIEFILPNTKVFCDWFFPERFVSVKKLRKQKINEIEKG